MSGKGNNALIIQAVFTEIKGSWKNIEFGLGQFGSSLKPTRVLARVAADFFSSLCMDAISSAGCFSEDFVKLSGPSGLGYLELENRTVTVFVIICQVVGMVLYLLQSKHYSIAGTGQYLPGDFKFLIICHQQ